MNRKKLVILAIVCLLLALAIFTLDFWIYHYITPEGTISPVFRQEVGKPLITQLLGNLGVMFLYSSLMSLILAMIFGKGKEKN